MNAKTGPLCPYCRAACAEGAEVCPQCQAQYPWMWEIGQLRNELKKRETSRLRATMTLVDEMARGKVSREALRGFVGAWLFPRTAIVIGSVIGALVLIVQTYIIWSQTELLAYQAEASKVERAERLRERLAIVGNYREKLDLITHSMGADLELTSCEGQACTDAPVMPLIYKLADVFSGTPPSEEMDVILRTVDVFAEFRTNENLPPIMGKFSLADYHQMRQSLFEPAAIQCLADVDKVRHATLALMIVMEVADGSRLVKLQRAASDSKRRILNETADTTFGAAALKLYFFRHDKIDGNDEWTTGAFLADLSQTTVTAFEGTKTLRDKCGETYATDLQALEALYKK